MAEIIDFQEERKKREKKANIGEAQRNPECLFDCLPYDVRRFWGTVYALSLKHEVEGKIRMSKQQKKKMETEVANLSDREVWDELMALTTVGVKSAAFQAELRWNVARFCELYARSFKIPPIEKS